MNSTYTDCTDFKINCEAALSEFCKDEFITTFEWEVTPVFQDDGWFLALIVISGISYTWLAL